MVTWLKKVSYKTSTKIVAVLLLCASVILIAQGVLGILQSSSKHNYYETWEFKGQFINKAGYVRDWIVRYADESIFDPESITEEEINNYIVRDYGYNYEYDVEEPNQSYEEYQSENSNKRSVFGGVLTTSKTEATTATTEVTVEENSKAEDTSSLVKEAKQGIIRDRKNYFRRIEGELIQENVNVEFFAINRRTNQVITNRVDYKPGNEEEIIKDFKDTPVYLQGDGDSINEVRYSYEYGVNYDIRHYNYYEGNGLDNAGDYEIYVAMSTTPHAGDVFYEQQLTFNNVKNLEPVIYALAVSGLVLSLLIGIYGIKVVGKKSEDDKVYLNPLDKIPFEIQVILYGFTLLLCLVGFVSVVDYHNIFEEYVRGGSATLVLMYLVVSAGTLVGILFTTSCIRHIKNKSFTQNILIVKIVSWLGNNIKEKNLTLWTIGGLICYIGLNGLCLLVFKVAWGVGMILVALFWFGFNTLMAIGIVKVVTDYKQIAKGAKKIASGQFDVAVKIDYTLPIIKEMEQTINNIGVGLEEAVERTVKSERLKTELITNVSHDLKTPLTSIISYIDLLKGESIENETAKEYIEVLSERSNRLKQLVEDLVEASKAATGNVKAELSFVELSQLVVQSVGEYSDRLEASGLNVIMNPLEDVNILADGRHMWRIIENLLSNVSKYAMPNTRVYIEVRKEQNSGKLIVKNISKESLNLLDPNELTERFVRGEESRTTEGSGLGLAIAQSLVQVQGGTFKIELDGDLFKVEVSMPLDRLQAQGISE